MMLDMDFHDGLPANPKQAMAEAERRFKNITEWMREVDRHRPRLTRLRNESLAYLVHHGMTRDEVEALI